VKISEPVCVDVDVVVVVEGEGEDVGDGEKKIKKKRAAEVDAADETTDVPAKQRPVRARTNLQQQLDKSQRTVQELAQHSIRSNAWASRCIQGQN
jgi:hypothetical protein